MEKTVADHLRESGCSHRIDGFGDDIVFSSFLIKVREDWIPTSKEIWNSWTGLRMAMGREYHGPIYSFEAAKNNVERIYTGRRECVCETCQEHVLPEMRPN